MAWFENTGMGVGKEDELQSNQFIKLCSTIAVQENGPLQFIAIIVCAE